MERTISEKSVTRFVEYLRDRELAENTVEAYRYAVEEFQMHYGSLTSDNLRAWKEWLIREHSVQTANLRIAAMNQYIIGFRKKQLHLAQIKRFKTTRAPSVENVITEADYQRLISGLTADGNLRWAGYYQILAKTGARISEALQLTVNDLLRGSVTMKTKGKVRRIWLPKGLITDVRELYADAGPNDRLIVNRYGKPMSQRGFDIMMKKHADQYGIPRERMHPHSLRHFYALQFMKRCPDISLLADLLGHSRVDTTMIYARKSAEEQQQILNQTMNW